MGVFLLCLRYEPIKGMHVFVTEKLFQDNTDRSTENFPIERQSAIWVFFLKILNLVKLIDEFIFICLPTPGLFYLCSE